MLRYVESIEYSLSNVVFTLAFAAAMNVSDMSIVTDFMFEAESFPILS